MARRFAIYFHREAGSFSRRAHSRACWKFPAITSTGKSGVRCSTSAIIPRFPSPFSSSDRTNKELDDSPATKTADPTARKLVQCDRLLRRQTHGRPRCRSDRTDSPRESPASTFATGDHSRERSSWDAVHAAGQEVSAAAAASAPSASAASGSGSPRMATNQFPQSILPRFKVFRGAVPIPDIEQPAVPPEFNQRNPLIRRPLRQELPISRNVDPIRYAPAVILSQPAQIRFQ